MGCTGSKYQPLQVDGPEATPTAPPPAASPPASSAGNSGEGQPDVPQGAAPSQSDDALGPPPWGAGSRNESASAPAFEPPLAESAGDDDGQLEMECASENVEERFPPWKEADQKSTAWNKLGPGVAFSAPGEKQVWEPITNFENTVIIFDWDDTLLCSSALHCCLPNQFVELEETVETVLLMAMSLGRTIIVTNAMESWIQETARRFMPRLIPTLERLLIVYARKNWERLWPGDTFAWKREAFRELLHDKLGHDLNLVVIGDSLSEIRAAEALADSLGSAALVKTVKFKALPSPSDLLGELRTIMPELVRLVEERRSATKELCQDAPSASVFASSMFQTSPNWYLLDAVPCDTDTPPPGCLAPQGLWNVMPPPGTQITI